MTGSRGGPWRTEAFDAALATLCSLYELPLPPPSERAFDFHVQLPRADHPGEAIPPGSLGMSVGIWLYDSPGPNWLVDSSFEARSSSESIASELVPVRVAGHEAVLHVTDGWFVSAHGERPGTNESWELREVAPRLSVAAWSVRASELCSEVGGPIADPPADETRFVFFVGALCRLRTLNDSPLGAAATRVPAMEMLFSCAWADRSTTRQWWGEIRRVWDRLAGDAKIVAVDFTKERDARNRLVDDLCGRIWAGSNFWGLPAEYGEEVRIRGREWITRRIAVLWDDYRRRLAAEK